MRVLGSTVACVLVCLAVVGCGNSDDEAERPAFVGAADDLPVSCHPFRSAGACGVPFPSSVYLDEDASTPTGFRVALPAELLPASAATEDPFDPAPWNRADGFSWATPIVAYFPEKLDDASLPSQNDFTESLSPQSATVIVDMDSGELVPHFSELDLSADITPEERQPLILRPARHLQPNHHYAVGITRSLHTLDGAPPARPAGFDSAIRGAKSSEPLVAKALKALPDTLAALSAAGVAKSDLLLAWDFRTQSQEQATHRVLSMRDQALEKAGDMGLGFTIDSVETAPNAQIFKRVRGTFQVPSFLTSDDRTLAEAELVLDDADTPVFQSVATYPFDLVIPASADTAGPYPLLVYGHGLLGSADEIAGSHVRNFCNDKGYVCIGTDWIGLSEQEESGIGQNGASWEAIRDINHFAWVGDRLQQSLVNFMVLTRTAKSILADPQVALTSGQSPLADPFEVYYYGISQGSIMGASLLAYSPDIQRGVLQVGGTAYSLMIQRSVNWNQFFPTIRNAYPDRVAQHLLMALWQPQFDFSEGSGTAWAQGQNPPLAGTSEKQVLMQIAVGDSQVTNLAAAVQARTLGLPLLTPSALDIWGLQSASDGAPTAISTWDLVREPPPTTNATPVSDNDVHGDIRKLPENQEQTDVFLRTGQVKDTCGGKCEFPGGP